MQGITTSIRLPTQLSHKLERASHTLHRGKNWIIKQALEDYLAKLEYSNLVKEAQRQSLLASKKALVTKEGKNWEDDADTEGWE